MRWSDDEIRRQFSVADLIKIREGLAVLVSEIRRAEFEDRQTGRAGCTDYGVGKEIAAIADLSGRIGRLIGDDG